MTNPTDGGISTKNVFADYIPKVYAFTYRGRILINQVMGGTPSDQKVVEGWLKTKMGISKEDILQEAVKDVMAERGLNQDEALAEIGSLKHLNGFKRDEDGLYIEGRHLKAAIKEAASVARAAENLPGRFGATNKGTLAFIAEHIVVVEDRLYLAKIDPATRKLVPVHKADDVIQSFPKNPMTKQTGIQNTEYVQDAVVEFTIQTDYPFTQEEFAVIWVTGGNQGIGASRSQGYGRYKVIQWEAIGSGKRIADKLKEQAKVAKAAAKTAAKDEA